MKTKLKVVEAILENSPNRIFLSIAGWGGKNVADLGPSTPDTRELADHIVKCVNAHDELVGKCGPNGGRKVG